MDHGSGESGPGELLPGAFSTPARVGGTVRRSTGPWTPAVHALLRHLERAGFEGAPRVLGFDVQRREVLTFVPGHVPRNASPEVATDRALFEAGRLSGATARPPRASRCPRAWCGTAAGPIPARGRWSATTTSRPGTPCSAEGARWRKWTSTWPTPPSRRGTRRASPGSSCRSPTTRVAHARGGRGPRTARAGCASCATATGSPKRSGRGYRNSLPDAWRRPRRALRRWPPRTCPRTNGGRRRACRRSCAPTVTGSSGTAGPPGGSPQVLRITKNPHLLGGWVDGHQKRGTSRYLTSRSYSS